MKIFCHLRMNQYNDQFITLTKWLAQCDEVINVYSWMHHSVTSALFELSSLDCNCESSCRYKVASKAIKWRTRHFKDICRIHQITLTIITWWTACPESGFLSRPQQFSYGHGHMDTHCSVFTIVIKLSKVYKF